MSGSPWLIRTTDTYDLADGFYLSEIFYHLEDSRLGIGGEVLMSWWPSLDLDLDALILPENYTLTGQNGGLVNSEIVWKADSVAFRPVHDALPYETYQYLDEALTISLSGITVTYASDDLFNAGCYSSLEDFSTVRFVETQTIDQDVSQADVIQPIGNLYIRRKASSDLNVIINNSYAPIKAKNKPYRANWNQDDTCYLTLTTPDMTSMYGMRDIILRSWILNESLFDTKLTFAFVIEASQPIKFNSRIGNQIMTVEKAMTYSANNMYAIYYDPSVIKYSTSLFIDWITNILPQTFVPFSDLEVKLGRMTVLQGHQSVSRLNLAQPHADLKRSFAYTWANRGTEIINDTITTVLFPKPLIYNSYELTLSDTSVEILAKDRYGFTISSTQTTPWNLTYEARVVGTMQGF